MPERGLPSDLRKAVKVRYYPGDICQMIKSLDRHPQTNADYFCTRFCELISRRSYPKPLPSVYGKPLAPTNSILPSALAHLFRSSNVSTKNLATLACSKIKAENPVKIRKTLFGGV